MLNPWETSKQNPIKNSNRQLELASDKNFSLMVNFMLELATHNS